MSSVDSVLSNFHHAMGNKSDSEILKSGDANNFKKRLNSFTTNAKNCLLKFSAICCVSHARLDRNAIGAVTWDCDLPI